MKSLKLKALTALLVAVTTVCACLPFTACGGKKYKQIGAESDFLKTEGELVKNGAGETVYLRGINAGGLFVTEHWMTGFAGIKNVPSDYKTLTQTFIKRFGAEKTKELWAEYRANWWSDIDFKNCADMGMTVIRLPFTYMNVDFDAITDYGKAGNYDFSALDEFVSNAAKYGMYTILDLHGAYGSQNGKDHSGQRIDDGTVDFYSNTEMKGLTVNLWSALAEHYKDNAAVAGYDILNEPGELAGSTSERHWNFYDEVYDAIREKDDGHIVIFESCWNGENLPRPERYGWENCIYSFHHYADSELSDTAHDLDWNNKIANVTSQNFGVPLQMGEFTSYTSAAKWEYTLDLMNRSGWHWTSWTYKIWGSMPWGVVNIIGTNDEKVNCMEDDYDAIIKKFKKLRTDGDSAQKYTFYNRDENGEKVEYKTLEEMFTELIDVSQPVKLAEGGYVLYHNGDDVKPLTLKGNIGGNPALALSDSASDMAMLTVKYHSSNDGSAYISAGGKNLTVTVQDNINYVTAKNSSGNDARFYPVICGDGVAFVSYSTCKYLTVDGTGAVRADGDRSQAAVFIAEGEVKPE